MFDRNELFNLERKLKEFANSHKTIYIADIANAQFLFSLMEKIGIQIKGIVSMNNNETQRIKMNLPVYRVFDLIIATPPPSYIGIILFDNEKHEQNNLSLNIKLQGKQISIPVFAANIEEVSMLYDTIVAIEIIQQQERDYGAVHTKRILQHIFRGLSNLTEEDELIFYMQINKKFKKMPVYSISDTAIVMTGLIEYRNDFTVKTALMYRTWYPNVPIIISTWKGEVTQEFKQKMQQINVKVLESDYPEYAAPGHLNYQIASPRYGIEYIKNTLKGINYVLKCRSDWSFNRHNFLIYLKNLLKSYPANAVNMKERLIFMYAVIGYKQLPFAIDDYLAFGTVEDMEHMYSMPLVTREEAEPIDRCLKRFYPWVEKSGLCELLDSPKINYSKHKYFLNKCILLNIYANFYKKYIAPIDENHVMEASRNFLKNCAIIVDAAHLMAHWPKYEYTYRYEVFQCYEWPTSGGLDFIEWLNIYLSEE